MIGNHIVAIQYYFLGESTPLLLTLRQCGMYLYDGLPSSQPTSGVVLPLLSCRRGKDGVMVVQATKEASTKNETNEDRLRRLQEERQRIDDEIKQLQNVQE